MKERYEARKNEFGWHVWDKRLNRRVSQRVYSQLDAARQEARRLSNQERQPQRDQ